MESHEGSYKVAKLIRYDLVQSFPVFASVRWLKYQFKRLNLKRRHNRTSRQHIVALIKVCCTPLCIN